MARKHSGKIELDIRDSTPDWDAYLPPRAPDGAPNVLLLAWDDLGYATMDIFGGPVETPTMRRLADMGVRFSNFHTTALCSPTRASLLTGRNATSNGMATIAEFSAGFPGISTRIPFENGFLSEVLAEHGYNTYCVGKWHLTPGEECNLAAYKGRWPLGRGFERFYGWLGGETNSWYPDLVHDNHQVDPPATPEEGYHLADDLADQGDRVRPRRQGDRPRQAVLLVPRPPGRTRARTTSPRNGPIGTGARSTRGTKPSGPASSPVRRNSVCCPLTPSSPRSTRTVNRGAPGPTGSRGRCSTRYARGIRSAPTSSGSSPEWPRCSRATSPTTTTVSVG